jgi:Predicted acyltransferases
MQRKYDIDWLRTVIVLSIIPFHAMVIFNQNNDWVMYVKDKMDVAAFNFIDCIIGCFNMTTLFLLAGIAINYSLKNRSVKDFVSQRFKKLFIPLIVGIIFLNPLMTYIGRLNQGGNESFYQHYIGFFTKNPGALDGQNGGFTPGHLWFVLYLFLFSLIGLPFFLFIRSEKFSKFKNLLAEFFYRPMTILLLILPYCFIYLIEILDDKNPLAYFYILLVGCLLASNERYLKALSRDKWIYSALMLVVFVIYFTYLPQHTSTIGLFLRFLLGGLSKIIPALSLLGIFNSFINKNTKVLKYLSGASYTIYIIHLLIVTAVGFFVIKLSITPILKLLLIVILSYALCFAIYELLKRTKYVGMLFGTSANRSASKLSK